MVFVVELGMFREVLEERGGGGRGGGGVWNSVGWKWEYSGLVKRKGKMNTVHNIYSNDFCTLMQK